MLYVVTKGTMHYAGWADDKPVWLKTHPAHAMFTEDVAAMVVKQLTQLGHVVEVKPSNYNERKKVRR